MLKEHKNNNNNNNNKKQEMNWYHFGKNLDFFPEKSKIFL